MTPRSIRRAIERKAEKAARKAERNQLQPNDLPLNSAPPSTTEQDDAFRRAMNELRQTADRRNVSPHRVAANRANAQLSTGPTTETGKRISSLNAVKTGLTGRTVLLPSDDAERYLRHIQRFIADFKPADERESDLVQSLADAHWRLARIPGLEMAIFAKGRLEFADQFAHFDDATAIALIDAETLVKYSKQLMNLARQETRLRNQCKKDLAELQSLQQERAETAEAEPTKQRQQQKNGFEFANGIEVANEVTLDTYFAAAQSLETSKAA